MAGLREVNPKYLEYEESGLVEPKMEHIVFRHDKSTSSNDVGNILLSKIYFKEKLSETNRFKSYICKIELDPGICFVYEKDYADLKTV